MSSNPGTRVRAQRRYDDRPTGPRPTRRRPDQRGAVVVETALVISFFLIPLLVGVLTLGERLWQAQKKDPYEPRISSSQVVGPFSCGDLVTRVRNTVADNIAGLGVPIDVSWVEAQVVEIDPDVGVLVEVKVTVPPPDGTGDPVVTEASVQLENASLGTSIC